MSARIVIRPLVQADIVSLQEIDRAAHGRPWSHRTFLDEIEESNRTHLVGEFTGERAGELVGHASAWIDQGSCRITNVAVGRGYSSQGHATTLLYSLIEQTLSERRVRNMQLEVRAANRRAQRLYSRFGFVPVGIERDFYDLSDDSGSRDAVVMAVADVCSDTWRVRLDQIHSALPGRNDEEAA